MSKEEFSANEKVSGIWFLEENDIKELETLLNEAHKTLKKHAKSEVDRQVREALNSVTSSRRVSTDEELKSQELELRQRFEGRYPASKFEIAITEKSKTLSKRKEFSIAIEDLQVMANIPDGINVEIEHGRTSFSFSLGPGLLGDECSITVMPKNSVTAPILENCKRWAEKKREPHLFTQWQRLHVGLIFLTVLLTFMLVNVFTATKTVYPDIDRIRSRATSIIASGVDDTNRDEAISHLLTASFANTPQRNLIFDRGFSLWTLILGVGTALVLSLPPRTILGLAGGTKRLKRRRQYYYFLALTAPRWLVTGIATTLFGYYSLKIMGLS